jgi:hypothetical protein
MRRTRHAALLALTASLFLALAVTGCSDDDDTSPTGPAAEAPPLPDPEQLTFDFSFFDAAEDLDDDKSLGEYSHFLNAYLRVAILEVAAHLVLTPPTAAFALALHTPPSLQDDGSWIWVYTHVDGDEEAQIRLRGLPIDDGVEWELRVTVDAIDNEVWFAGTTRDDGAIGQWTFYDAENEPGLAVADLAWGRDDGGDFLRLEVLAGEDAGDVLAFHDDDPEFRIDHRDADQDLASRIVWWADGHGQLQVPDYNDGALACWDETFRNTVCEE